MMMMVINGNGDDDGNDDVGNDDDGDKWEWR